MATNPTAEIQVVDSIGDISPITRLTVRRVGRNRPTVVFRDRDRDIIRASVQPYMVLGVGVLDGERYVYKVSWHGNRWLAEDRMHHEARHSSDGFAVVRVAWAGMAG